MTEWPIDLQLVAVITPSALRHELTRSPLLQRLEEASDAKIIALLAPSGFGKTTLLGQYARATSRPTAWLALNDNHADPVVLAWAVAQSLTTAFPERMNGWLADPVLSAEQLGHQLSQLLATFEQNIGLILDGVQHLGVSALQWVEALAAQIGEGHQLLLAGYEGVPLRLARWVTQGQAVVIGSADLSFTAEESAVYLKSIGYPDDPALPAQALEGWPAGLALVASGASQYLTPETLVYDAMSLLPPEVQQALPAAAVVPVWSEPLVRHVTGALPPGWLETVRRAGLPLTPLRPGVFRPHTVLIQALNQLLLDEPDRYVALHAAAGRLAERDGNLLDALRHYQQAEQTEPAVRLAETLVPKWMRQLEYRLVRTELDRFSRADLPADLGVQLALALLETGEAADAETLLNQVQHRSGLTPLLSYGLANLVVRRGQLQLALDHVERGLGLQPDLAMTLKLLRLQAYLQVSLGQPEAAGAAARQAVERSEQTHDLFEQASSWAMLASINLTLNLLPEAEQATEQAIAIYGQLSFPAGTSGLYNDLAQIYRLTDRIPEAFTALEQVLPRARQDRSRYLPALLETLADLHFWQANHAAAIENYQAAADACELLGNKLLQVRIRYKLTDALRQGGRADEAQHLLIRLRSMLHHEDALLLSLQPFYEGLQALASGDFDGAAALFIAVLGGPVRPDRAARAAAYLAEVRRRQGTLTQQDLAPLGRHLALLGSDAALRSDDSVLLPLYETCRSNGWLPGLLNRVHSLEGHGRPAVFTPARLVLKLETLGRFQLSLGDQPVRVTVSKARELLTWLALEGPASREQIIDALWDGSNEYRHVEYFKVTVRRLRAVFTEQSSITFSPLVYEDGIYRMAEGLDLQVDVLGLHHCLQHRDLPGLRRYLERAHGPFLGDVEANWAERWRDQAQAELFTAALTLAAIPEARPEKVRWAYEQAIRLEPLAREGHEGLILYLQQIGELEAARLAYRTYARMLAEEFGDAVSDAFRVQLQFQLT